MIVNNNDFIKIIVEDKIEILKLHSTITEIKIYWRDTAVDLSWKKNITNELEHRLREIIQTKEPKKKKHPRN